MLESDLAKLRAKRNTIEATLSEVEEALSEIEEINDSIERVGKYAQQEFPDADIKQSVIDCLTDLFFSEVDDLEIKIKNEIDNLKETI